MVMYKHRAQRGAEQHSVHFARLKLGGGRGVRGHSWSGFAATTAIQPRVNVVAPDRGNQLSSCW